MNSFISKVLSYFLLLIHFITVGNTECCDCVSATHGINCFQDNICQSNVCEIDHWCCDVEWDDICDISASNICTDQTIAIPTPEPTDYPTPEPTDYPTPEPTPEPTPHPTDAPTPIGIACGDVITNDWSLHNVWFRFNLLQDMDTVIVDACDSEFDTILELYDATQTNLLRSDDDGCGDPTGQSVLTMNPLPHDTYFMYLISKMSPGIEGIYSLSIICNLPSLKDPTAINAQVLSQRQNISMQITQPTQPTTPQPQQPMQPTPEPTDHPTPEPTDHDDRVPEADDIDYPTPEPTDHPTPEPTDQSKPEPIESKLGQSAEETDESTPEPTESSSQISALSLIATTKDPIHDETASKATTTYLITTTDGAFEIATYDNYNKHNMVGIICFILMLTLGITVWYYYSKVCKFLYRYDFMDDISETHDTDTNEMGDAEVMNLKDRDHKILI